jgi:hypothetical protein
MLGGMAGDPVRGRLRGDAALEASAVVANCTMNRERQLDGVNSYARELGFNPLDLITGRLAGAGGRPAAATAGWLDLCCGNGRALIQAADRLRRAGLAGRSVLAGVDLAGVFDLDLSGIRLADGRPAGPRLAARLRAAGFGYDYRRHRISLTGRRDVRLPYAYLGADDRAGANYTGQPVVHGYYAEG